MFSGTIFARVPFFWSITAKDTLLQLVPRIEPVDVAGNLLVQAGWIRVTYSVCHGWCWRTIVYGITMRFTNAKLCGGTAKCRVRQHHRRDA